MVENIMTSDGSPVIDRPVCVRHQSGSRTYTVDSPITDNYRYLVIYTG